MVQSELADYIYILAPLTRSLKCQGVYFTKKKKSLKLISPGISPLFVIEKINTFLYLFTWTTITKYHTLA